MLKPGGRIAVVCLTKGKTLACRLYEWGHARWPALLDCRPIVARRWLEQAGFRLRDAAIKTIWGLAVEILLGVAPA